MSEKVCPYVKTDNGTNYCRSYIQKRENDNYPLCGNDFKNNYERCIWHIKFAWKDLPKRINHKIEDLFG
jgi:hypothetical protein